jgi:hypothetical protein
MRFLVLAVFLTGCTTIVNVDPIVEIDIEPTPIAMGNSVCSDNAPHCLSSPPCVGNWVGTDCQIGGIQGLCADTGNPNAGILTPCCSCNNTSGTEPHDIEGIENGTNSTERSESRP